MFNLYGGNHNGQFPQVAEEGPRAYAAAFVPALREAGCFKNYPVQPVCDPYGRRPGPIPTAGDVESARDYPDPERFLERARQLAGNYAYTLGYRDNGALHGLSVKDCDQPIMADHRPRPVFGDNSPNHGGRGQNVLFVGGNVKWLTAPTIGPKVDCEPDDIYLNRVRNIAAGVDCDDTVLGPGEASPGRE
jgi:hypothetical protein